MRCIVTGGAGFIGGHLVDKLVEDGHQVFIFDNYSTGDYRNLKAHYYHLDLEKLDPNWSYLTPPSVTNIDVIFHLAAKARIIPSLSDPHGYLSNNIQSTLNMLEWARRNGVKKFIYSSSSSAEDPLDPFSDPSNPYAYSKLKGEELCKLYSKLYGMQCSVLRYFNVYGDRMSNIGGYQTVLSIFKDRRDRKLPIEIYGDGSQRRDFTFVDDVVSANLLVAERNIDFGIFDVGSGINYSILEVAELFDCPIEYLPDRGERQRTLADPIKLIRLGWNPTMGVKRWILTKFLI